MSDRDDSARDDVARPAGRARDSSGRLLVERVRQQHEMRERARREPVGSLWRTVAQVGTLGWLLALPPVVGAFAGHLLDMWLGTGISIALGLMLLGLTIGGYFYWRAVQETTPPENERKERGS